MSDYTALVVEDSPTMRQLLVSALNELTELEVLEAEDGVDGLRRLRERKVDILITDINMPMMDGLKLVGMVLGSNHRDIPIIIVTTEGAKEDRTWHGTRRRCLFCKACAAVVVVATVSSFSECDCSLEGLVAHLERASALDWRRRLPADMPADEAGFSSPDSPRR